MIPLGARLSNTSGLQPWLPVYNRNMRDAELLEHIGKLAACARLTSSNWCASWEPRGRTTPELETALARLAARGDLIELRSGHYAATARSREFAVGRAQHAPRRLRLPDLRPAHRGIHGRHLHPARVGREGHARRPRGGAHRAHRSRMAARMARSSRCCKRAHPTVVGEFRIGRRGQYVVPHDDRIQQWIEIPEGMEIPPAGPVVDRIGVAAPRVRPSRNWTA